MLPLDQGADRYAAKDAPEQASPNRAAPGIVGHCPARRVQDLLSPILEAEWLRRFRAEHAPYGPTEDALVKELARHASAAERWTDTAGAAERHAARALTELSLSAAATDDAGADGLLVAAMSTEAGERSERHSLARSRVFLRVLRTLQDCQSRRRERERLASPPPAFADEASCLEYLAVRFRQGLACCVKCGAAGRGWFLESHAAWECASCGAQTGLRRGTIMERSQVPLRSWFEAVRIVVWRPGSSVLELSRAIDVPRIATVGAMLRKIKSVLRDVEEGVADDRLAGLADHFSQRRQPEPGAPT